MEAIFFVYIMFPFYFVYVIIYRWFLVMEYGKVIPSWDIIDSLEACIMVHICSSICCTKSWEGGLLSLNFWQ